MTKKIGWSKNVLVHQKELPARVDNKTFRRNGIMSIIDEAKSLNI